MIVNGIGIASTHRPHSNSEEKKLQIFCSPHRRWRNNNEIWRTFIFIHHWHNEYRRTHTILLGANTELQYSQVMCFPNSTRLFYALEITFGNSLLLGGAYIRCKRAKIE